MPSGGHVVWCTASFPGDADSLRGSQGRQCKGKVVTPLWATYFPDLRMYVALTPRRILKPPPSSPRPPRLHDCATRSCMLARLESLFRSSTSSRNTLILVVYHRRSPVPTAPPPPPFHLPGVNMCKIHCRIFLFYCDRTVNSWAWYS